MSNETTISRFFTGAYFEIPKYQRGYSWEEKQIREFFDDISEAIDSSSSHYLGTIVISPVKEEYEKYYLIDGQQRITTIIMIIDAIVDSLDKEEAAFYRRTFIKSDNRYKLVPSIRDREFFEGIIEGVPVESKNKAQSLLAAGYRAIKERLGEVKDKKAVLDAIIKMKFVIFEEHDQSRAIQIFQTVNDRGRPLTNIEKVKSLLMYYSDKFLNDELNDALNDNFGDIFEAYEEIKEYGEKLGISLIKDKTFNEDTIMCYHYVTFYKDNYSPNAEYVLASLKEKLSAFGKNRDSDGITKLIKAYAEHLTTFFRYLRSLVKRAEEDERLYKLFSVLGLSANLYPLLVAADIKNLLYRPLSTDGNYLLLDILEGLDIKVYKTLGSWAAKWMAGIAYETMNGELNLEKELMNYSRHYCDESYFKKCLRKYAYHNRALVHILIAYCEHLSDETYGTERLRELMSNKGGPSKEHILSQTPDFDPIAFGFTDGEDYNEHLNGIGNITLLEWSLNSGAGNRSFLKKSEIYSKSAFKITSRLGAWLAENKNFKKADMQEREEELINFCVTRWRF